MGNLIFNGFFSENQQLEDVGKGKKKLASKNDGSWTTADQSVNARS